jgi:hypothetical protein
VWAAPELLGAPTIGRGSARSRGGGGGDHRSLINLLRTPEIYKNDEKTVGFVRVFAYKSPKTSFFAQKYLTRYTHEMFIEEHINCSLSKPLRGYTCLKFWKSYTPPAARIRVKAVQPLCLTTTRTI